MRATVAREDVGTRSIRAIALFETGKGVFALLGVGALLALGPDALRHAVAGGMATLQLAPADGSPSSLLDRITPDTVSIASAAIAAYGLMRLLEGWGLWRHRIWASWLGCIGAALYIPFEIYALWRQQDWLTWGVLLLNLLIVAVLARDIARRR